MPLSKRLVPIAFREGIDTKTSPVNSVPGRLLELENGVFGKIGEIRKRYGYDRLSSNVEGGTALSSCDGLATFRDELLSFSAGRLYSYSEARSGWVDRGAAQTALVTETPIIRNTYAQTAPDVAILSGLRCAAWEDSRGGVRYSISDESTGAAIVADAEINAAGTRPYVVAFESAFFVFYAIGNNIFYRRVAVSDPKALGGEVNPIATLDPTNVSYDLAVVGSRLYVIWGRTTNTTLAYFDSSLALTTVTSSLGTCEICTLFGDASGNVLGVLSDNTNQVLIVIDSAGATVSGPSTLSSDSECSAISGVSIGDATTDATIALLYGVTAATHRVSVVRVSRAGVVLSSVTTRGVSLHAKAFAYSGAAYVPVVYDSDLQSTVFVLDAAGNVVAKGSPGLAGGNRQRNTMANVATAADGSRVFAGPVRSALESVAGDIFTRNGAGIYSLNLGASRFHSAEIGNNLVVAGGVVNAYDGVTFAEQGFHLYPEGTTAAVAAGGGGLTNGRVYRWRAVYEWTDAFGQVHRSAPGAVTIAGAESYTSAAGSETVTLTIPTLRLTGKGGVRIAIYRTLGNGSLYYRLTPIASPTLNDKTANSVTFVDTYADTAIEGNELLYTDGAAGSPLDNIAPGYASGIVTHGGRCFLVTGPNKISSSQLVEQGEALAFSDADALQIIPDPRGGNIVALGSMDDKLVIFKNSAIYATYGNGPDDSGTGEFPTPQLVSSDVGCSEARSVVLTSAGLMFKSSKGIYILDRSLQVTYIGAQVEDYNSLTITSAVMVADQNQVRFTCEQTDSVIVGTETVSNVSLVYDYAFNQWGIFTNCGAVDAVIWDGIYTRARSDAKTYKESTTSYDDDGSFVKLKLTTSWLSFAGVQGFQRIYRVFILGEYKSAHSLRVRIGYNFSPAFPDDQTINAETAIAPGSWGSSATWGSDSYWGGNASVEWFVRKPTRQKCSAIRVSIEDSQSSSYAEGYSISNLALLVGVKRGGNKLAASRVI